MSQDWNGNDKCTGHRRTPYAHVQAMNDRADLRQVSPHAAQYAAISAFIGVDVTFHRDVAR